MDPRRTSIHKICIKWILGLFILQRDPSAVCEVSSVEQSNKHLNQQTNTPTHQQKQTHPHTNKQTNIPTNKQINKQTHKTNIQTHHPQTNKQNKIKTTTNIL